MRVLSLAGRGDIVLGRTLYSLSAFLHPGVEMGATNLMLGVVLRWTSIPSRRYDRLGPRRYRLFVTFTCTLHTAMP